MVEVSHKNSRIKRLGFYLVWMHTMYKQSENVNLQSIHDNKIKMRKINTYAKNSTWTQGKRTILERQINLITASKFSKLKLNGLID